MPLVKPAGYRNLLDNVENTEKAIKLVKDMFQQNLSAQLALLRVTAPMVVLSGTGINDFPISTCALYSLGRMVPFANFSNTSYKAFIS